MTTSQKYWLCRKLETQVLYGTEVYVLATSGSWSQVAVSGQPTPRNRWGYPGWLPSRQLTATPSTDRPVQLVSIMREPYLSEFAGGCRYFTAE